MSGSMPDYRRRSATRNFSRWPSKNPCPARQVDSDRWLLLCVCEVCRPVRLALPLLPNQTHGTTMPRLTAFLIVVTLTGLPVFPTACLTWCGEQDTATGSCHDEARDGSVFISSANVTCTALVADGWFVREEMRPVLHAVCDLPMSRTAVRPAIPTGHGFAGHERGASDAPPSSPIVLRV